MFRSFLLLSLFVLSTRCTLYHPIPISTYITTVQIPRVHDPNPKYNFAYEVNDAHTGDIKSQSETKRGDIILGQYSLVQPDGIRRTVEYRADSYNGFTATVNNEGRNINSPRINTNQQLDNNSQENQNDNNQSLEEQPIRQVQVLASRISNSGTTANPLPVSRSVYLQSVPNQQEQYISSIIH